MRGKLIVSTAVAALALLAAGTALPQAAQADTTSTPVPATGSFSFTTGPGILSTWDYNNIKVSTSSPASYSTKNNGTQGTANFPVVARQQTATFTGGQIRITNSKTGEYINCLNPAVEVLVKVVDCVMADKTNKRLFTIAKIGAVKTLNSVYTTTTSYTGLDLKITDQATADWMNAKLRTNTFSPSVVFATGELVSTYSK
ncbi:MAG: hypothetical protein F2806_09400 [Actinobacteria bacterium]|uniref:Unannotated protein n=1 Tax=freshwater metagenome TaxID=449393 RepID=A0A6J7H4J7_9ZZZZ|nr:hypothetical protein [Actinomycetota bacterium]